MFVETILKASSIYINEIMRSETIEQDPLQTT